MKRFLKFSKTVVAAVALAMALGSSSQAAQPAPANDLSFNDHLINTINLLIGENYQQIPAAEPEPGSQGPEDPDPGSKKPGGLIQEIIKMAENVGLKEIFENPRQDQPDLLQSMKATCQHFIQLKNKITSAQQSATAGFAKDINVPFAFNSCMSELSQTTNQLSANTTKLKDKFQEKLNERNKSSWIPALWEFFPPTSYGRKISKLTKLSTQLTKLSTQLTKLSTQLTELSNYLTEPGQHAQ